jgi:hypothetical protein
MSAQPEVWRVSTIEGVFETDLETLKQWIVEGCVLPTDKVTKGNQSWIDAGRVPKLKGAFNGDLTPEPKSATPSFETFVASSPTFNNAPPNYTTPTPWVEPPTESSSSPFGDSHSTDWVDPKSSSATPTANVCQNHPDAAPHYVCRMCGAVFCKACPKMIGGNTAVCPSCGDLCREYRAVTEKTARVTLQRSGFGMEDFVRAIRYPFQHQAALLGGALIYGALLFGGLRGSFLAWVFLFGCMSHTISQVAWGRLNRSFMPDFSAFSWWDDVIVPVFLGVGIIIVSWGPAIVLVFTLFFGAVSERAHSALPGGGQAAEASGPDVSVLTDPEADGAKLAEESAKLDGVRPGAVVAREAEKAQAAASDPTGSVRDLWRLLGGATAGDVLLLLVFAWGLFYHPMAFAVAGYTQSFGSVLNPLVGLDAIRRMRGTYFKALAMVILVYIVSLIVNGAISILTAPLALPFMGNIAGNYITALFAFYFSLVVACVLGLALFKCADRLGIGVD